MKEIDEMDMLGFLQIRAWDAWREHTRQIPKAGYIDQIWPRAKANMASLSAEALKKQMG